MDEDETVEEEWHEAIPEADMNAGHGRNTEEEMDAEVFDEYHV